MPRSSSFCSGLVGEKGEAFLDGETVDSFVLRFGTFVEFSGKLSSEGLTLEPWAIVTSEAVK